MEVLVIVAIVAMTVAVSAVVATTMLIPTIMAAIIVPVFAVFVFVAIADNYLVVTSPVTGILCTVNVIAYPGARLVNNYLIAVINIVVAIAVRQIRLPYPGAIAHVNILMCRNIVVNTDIGHVIIVGMVIAHGSPFGLCAYVYTQANVNLRVG